MLMRNDFLILIAIKGASSKNYACMPQVRTMHAWLCSDLTSTSIEKLCTVVDEMQTPLCGTTP